MIITSLIILLSGIIGGYANFHSTEENIEYRSFSLRKSILTGLVASATVPLFLNMVSSDLLKDVSNQGAGYKYFVFAGFCLTASYFSDRFLQAISKKVIQELENKTERIREEVASNMEKVETLVETNSDDLDEVVERETKIDMLKGKAVDESINTLLETIKNGNFVFRTIDGLTKSTGLEKHEIRDKVDFLKNNDLLKMYKRNDGTNIYSLTKKGKTLE